MLDKQMFKGVVAYLSTLSNEERNRRISVLKKNLDAEMKKRKMKPGKAKPKK